jgi:hypothetical protein
MVVMMTTMMIGTTTAATTPQKKRDDVWNHLLVNNSQRCQRMGITPTTTSSTAARTTATTTKWPSYNEVLHDIRTSDYNDILKCPHDITTLSEPTTTTSSNNNTSNKNNNCSSNRGSKTKTICPHGVVCCVRLELFPFPVEDKWIDDSRPYTGLLSPGTTVEYGLLRLSSALQATGGSRMARALFGPKLGHAKLFPAVAMKFFRPGTLDSGNVLFLGSKTGQLENDFFSHCVSTQLTSRMTPTLKPILRIFKRYSDHPLALGLSDFCCHSLPGEVSKEEVNFPFCLTLQPCVDKFRNNRSTSTSDGITAGKLSPKEAHDTFLDDLRSIPPQATIYDVYASPDPKSVADPSKLQRIGRIVTTSEMIDSPNDDGLFFRHQNKDEDFLLRPEWKVELNTTVTMKDGSTGTSQSLAGWELFEEQIATGTYRDYESTKEGMTP